MTILANCFTEMKNYSLVRGVEHFAVLCYLGLERK